MANQINRDVYVLSNKVKEHIDYVRFTNALPIVFTFRDYNIPQGSVATAFCTKPSGKAVYTDATISGNAITIDVSDQMFIELGRTVIQVKIENGSSTLVTFGWPVDVHENSTEGDIPPSQNESGFWDELQQQVDEAVENCNNAVDSVNQVIQESQQATQNANNAASNANEAAQQVFDEQYILTTKHTFGLSDTVEPTSEGNALVESMEGDTWQGENPSPESPQHIYGIGDTGYFDGELQQGVYRNSDGAFTNIAYGVSGLNKINVNPGDIVGLVSNPEYIVRISLFQNNGDFIKTYVNTNPNQGFIKTEPLPDSSGYVLVSVQSFDGVTPITPQSAGHIAVLINNNYAIKLETRGKNLIDFDKYYEAYGSNGEYQTIANNFALAQIDIPDEYIGKTVTFSAMIKISGNLTQAYAAYIRQDTTFSGNGIRNINDYELSKISFTVQEGDKIAVSYGTNGNNTVYVRNPQLEVGETVTEYTPYQGGRINLPISSPLYEGDSIVKINGVYKIRRVNGVAVFDGSEDENWIAGTTGGTYHNQYYIKIADCKSSSNLFCDKAVSLNEKEIGGVENTELFYVKYGNYFSVFTPKSFSEISSLTTFKTWLKSNPITVVYQLATPVYEDIDQQPFYDLMAADEVTNVSLLGENENLVPTNVIRFPRNEDGALSTTAYAVAKKYEDAYQGMTPSGIEDRLAALETQMAALNAQTIIVE